jgi:hypothetical protein
MVLLASAYDQSKYWRADDLDAPTRFKVKNVTEELVGRGTDREKKLALAFTSDPRLLLLNKTNIRTMKGAFGDPTPGWVGHVIELFRTTTEMGDGIRIRIPPPKQAAAGNGGESKPQGKPTRPVETFDPDADFEAENPF